MNTKHRVPRRTFTIRTKPPIMFDRSEARSMTDSEKQVFLQTLVDRAFLPVLGGSVPIREVFTPPGGWEPLDARHPNLRSYPPARQLHLAIWGDREIS